MMTSSAIVSIVNVRAAEQLGDKPTSKVKLHNVFFLKKERIQSPARLATNISYSFINIIHHLIYLNKVSLNLLTSLTVSIVSFNKTNCSAR